MIGNWFSIYYNAGRAAASGKLLLDYTFDLSDFSPGVYILTIEGERPMKIVKHKGKSVVARPQLGKWGETIRRE